MISGNLTAPAVYALEHPKFGAELEGLIQNEFDGGASLARALELVHLGGGIQAARRLARQEADMVCTQCCDVACEWAAVVFPHWCLKTVTSAPQRRPSLKQIEFDFTTAE